MEYSELVASEHASGNRPKRRTITKTGNAQLRRVVVEAGLTTRRAWMGGYLNGRR
jgi:transposase